MQEFGHVGFKQIESREDGKGGERRTIAFLNEPQAYMLITMMRNTLKVLDFKSALVKAFINLRAQLSANSHIYTPEQIAEIQDKARKQGYAIAMNYQSKKKESLTPEQIKEIKDVLGFYNDSRKASMSLMRELSDTVKLLLDVKEHLNILGHGYIVTHSRINEALANLKSE